MELNRAFIQNYEVRMIRSIISKTLSDLLKQEHQLKEVAILIMRLQTSKVWMQIHTRRKMGKEFLECSGVV
jgi:hypothetical protein